jgi:hypothetical protein
VQEKVTTFPQTGQSIEKEYPSPLVLELAIVAPHFLFVHNLSPIPTEVKFGSKMKVNGQLVNLPSDDHSFPDASGKHSIMLEPYGYRWFRIGGLDYLLKRTEF